MQKKDLEDFIEKYGCKVKIVLDNHFGITGLVVEIRDDVVVFSGNKETSFIPYDIIHYITDKTGGR